MDVRPQAERVRNPVLLEGRPQGQGRIIQRMRSLRFFCLISGLAISLIRPGASTAQFSPPFDASYSGYEFPTTGIPAGAGAFAFVPGDPNTLLMIGAASTLDARIYSVGVTRDVNGHMTALAGSPMLFALANGVLGGASKGLAYGPGGVLFYITSDNQLGEIKPGSIAPDRLIDLTPLGVATGGQQSLSFVPSGLAGSGDLKVVANNGGWYNMNLTPDGIGTFNVSVDSFIPMAHGGVGINFVSSASNPVFGLDSVLVASYSDDLITAYAIDANGDPIIGTGRTFRVAAFASGGAVDPVTGDFLFTTLDNVEVNRIGFPIPEPSAAAFLCLGALVSQSVLYFRRTRRQ